MAEKVMIAMSGGVDSSVAALLIKNMGYEATGGIMRLYDGDSCGSVSDAEDARRVAEGLGMRFFVFDLREDFRKEVMDRFARAYERGVTPNPCIDCNRYMKFGKFMEKAAEHGCSAVATGHYARVEKCGERYLLKKGLDLFKDQSYVLYSLTQSQLSRLILPLGGLTKEETRRIAEENGFLNAAKKDSQDICFVPDGDYAAFIGRHTGKVFEKGLFVGTNGEIYGEHKGVIHYTVGQRKGLGLSFPQPMYVCRVDVDENKVVLGRHEELFSSSLTANDINLISVDEIKEPMRVKAKVRYRHSEQPATVTQTGADEIRVVFDAPQRAITKGQAVVLYDGDTVIGGGAITSAGT